MGDPDYLDQMTDFEAKYSKPPMQLAYEAKSMIRVPKMCRRTTQTA